MDDVSEYRRHANRCRQLAAERDGLTKKYLEDMAKMWEGLAKHAGAQPQAQAGASASVPEPL
jgi:hypothetical protein